MRTVRSLPWGKHRCDVVMAPSSQTLGSQAIPGAVFMASNTVIVAINAQGLPRTEL